MPGMRGWSVKFLAILRDSFREAVDSKVFSVMLALSGVLMVVVASMSFEPRPVTELQQRLEDSLNRDLQRLGAAAPRNLKIVGAEPLPGTADRPDSPFQF